jgi:hypothetical protein
MDPLITNATAATIKKSVVQPKNDRLLFFIVSSLFCLRYCSNRVRHWQAAEKRPSVPRFAGFPSSFPVSNTGQACCGAQFQVRVVCHFLGLRISGALHLGIFEQPAKNDIFSNHPGDGLNSFTMTKPKVFKSYRQCGERN